LKLATFSKVILAVSRSLLISDADVSLIKNEKDLPLDLHDNVAKIFGTSLHTIFCEHAVVNMMVIHFTNPLTREVKGKSTLVAMRQAITVVTA
jgi:hypothetical protein